MKHIYFFLFAFLAVMTSNAQALDMDPKIRHGKLDNGLTYFIVQNSMIENRADFYLAQKVGSIQEDDNQAGLAHFLEHMAFKRTKNFPGTIIDRLEQYGAKMGPNINAYTSFDQTVYYLTDMNMNTAGVLDTCLLILHDWCGFISLEGDDIEAERKVIREEWRTSSGAGYRTIEKLFPIIYEGSKYADRMPIGKIDVINNFNHDELRAYYRKWYRPDLQGIIIAGDIDVDYVESKIKALFSDIPKPVNPAERIYYPVPDNNEPIVAIKTDPESTTTSLAMFIKHNITPLEKRNTLEYLTLGYVKNMISLMISSRLREISQKPDAPFSAMNMGYSGFYVSATKDAWSASASVKEGMIKETFEIMVRENERIKRFGFIPAEVERAKADMLKSLETRYDNKDKQYNFYFSQTILNSWLSSSPIPGIEKEFELMKTIIPTLNVNVFNEFVKNVITDNNIVVMMTGPEKEGLAYPTKEELFKIKSKVQAENIEAYTENISDEPLISNLPPSGKVIKEEKGQFFDEVIWTLSNGMRVVLKKTDLRKDQYNLSATAYGGTSLLPDDDVNGRYVSAVASIGGVGNFNVTDLRKALAGKSAVVNPMISRYTQGFVGGGSTKDMETSFQLIHLYFTSIRKDIDAYDAFVERQENALKNRDSDPANIFSDSINMSIYGDHPRVRTVEVKDLDNLNYDKMLAYYKQAYANPGSFLFDFVGDFDLNTVKEYAEKYLASLPSGNKNATYKELNMPIRKGNIVNRFTQKMEIPKASSLLYYSGTLDRNEKVKYQAGVLMQILDMIFRRTIREEEGGTYGVRTNVDVERIPMGQSFIQITYTTEPKRVDELNGIIRRELNNLAENGPTDEDLKNSLEYMIKNRDEWQKMNGFWIAVLDILHFYGEDENSDYTNIINSITKNDIKAMVKDLLSQGNMVEVIMLPQE